MPIRCLLSVQHFTITPKPWYPCQMNFTILTTVWILTYNKHLKHNCYIKIICKSKRYCLGSLRSINSLKRLQNIWIKPWSAYSFQKYRSARLPWGDSAFSVSVFSEASDYQWNIAIATSVECIFNVCSGVCVLWCHMTVPVHLRVFFDLSQSSKLLPTADKKRESKLKKR